MHRWLPILVLLLGVVPILALVAVGGWALWETGRLSWIWWSIPICWGLAFLLARRGRDQDALLGWAKKLKPLPHWTPHDEKALRIIQQQQQAVKAIPPEKLTDPHFFLATARGLALRIARHYHPKAKDPIGSLTILEILAVAHLAAEELEVSVRKYLPGSHLLTVDQWRTLAEAPGWLRVAGDVSWMVAMLFQPANLSRYIVSKLTMEPASRQIQANLLAWFYVMFVRHVGYYVIEMNSGRLRGGTDTYRHIMAKLHDGGDQVDACLAPPDPDAIQETAGRPVEVTVSVVGQVNAGKSSLINVLLGEHKAATDVLPLTQGIAEYRLELPETRDRLVLLDTVGYGADALSKDQIKANRAAFRQADLVLLVLRANSPARESDLNLIREMSGWFGSRVHLKPPPVLAVLTHIDGLSPLMEWSPPYDWLAGFGPKERTIQAALEHTRNQFGERLAGAVPVCADVDRGRAYGGHEWLLPTMTRLLDEARACALVRTLHRETDSGKVRQVVGQLRNAGSRFLSCYLSGDLPLQTEKRTARP